MIAYILKVYVFIGGIMSVIIEQAQAVGFDLLIVIGGLGLFLFGMNSLGEELKSLAGSKLKTIIDKYTTSKYKGLIVGIVVTAIIQSSSATTALVISLIRSGIMTLNQALGVMMGANIGTTITAILIGFNLGDLAPYILLFGAFLELLSNKKRTKNIARLLVSFGMLFFGLELMGDGLKVLADMPVFTEFAISLSHNKFLGVLIGIGMTMVIQSSSATVGILQTIYAQGALSLDAALPILLGDNIGTTITAVLASIGGTIQAKKAAYALVLMKTVGTIVFLLFLPVYSYSVSTISAALELNLMMELAFAHFFFNVVNTALLFPFINQIEKAVNFIFRNKETDEEVEIETIFELSVIKESPAMALGIAHNATVEMANNCKSIFKYTEKFINEKDMAHYDKALEHEELVNQLNQKASDYLVEISTEHTADTSGYYLNYLIYTIKDLERIGDHLMNVNNHFVSIYENKEDLSEDGKIDLEVLLRQIDIILSDLCGVIEEPSRYLVDRIFGVEDEINALEKEARIAFIGRLKNRVPMGTVGMALYVDILSDLERVGDYSCNISKRIQETVL